jgi:hypothetical protein
MTSNVARDLSSGLTPDREQIVLDRPDITNWSENLFYTLYDPATDLGMWMHLGTVPWDWSMWEDWIMIALPGDGGAFYTRAYERTAPADQPAGANLRFECIEPFKTWKLEFDGRCLYSSYDDMLRRRMPEGTRNPVKFDLTATCITPAWDAHTSALIGSEKGSIRDQSWASDHYQQLMQITGTVELPDSTLEIDAYGWRDHSRGPRYGPNGARWGGHSILGGHFPSGRGFGLSRMWRPDGTISLNAGFVIDEHGELHHADVLDVPRLRDLQLRDESVTIGLRSAIGDTWITGITTNTTWFTRNHGIAAGVELEGEASILAESYARWEWDGEVGYGMCERSEHMHDIPEFLPPEP